MIRNANDDPPTNPAVNEVAIICDALPFSCFGTFDDNGAKQNPDDATNPLLNAIPALITMATSQENTCGLTHITNNGMNANLQMDAINNTFSFHIFSTNGCVVKFFPI